MSKSKARVLADLLAAGQKLEDGVINVAEIGDLTATATELNFVAGVTSSVQNQINNINTDLANDTSPQLAANLDVNSNDITGTGNVNITGTVTATSFSGDGSTLSGVESESEKTTNRGYWTVDTTKNNQFLGKYTLVRVMPSNVTIGGTWETLPNAEIYVLESTTLNSFDEYFEEDTTIASGTTHTFYQELNIREGVTVTVNGTLEGFGATPTGSVSSGVTLTQVQSEIDNTFIFEAFGESA